MNLDVEEKQVPDYTYAVAVRFRNAGKAYSFGTYDNSVRKGDKVVVESAQGLEVGVAEADAIDITRYPLTMPEKPVIRIATDTDLTLYEDNLRQEEIAYRICQLEIETLGLEMNLLSASYTLDRTKVLFIYLADQRVDFRELLKRLGSKLHCRIELRQIGERDKAKMVGGIGMCGMECCCRKFKNRFDVISINMAKNQMLALNIDKLSGMCGKLMCCLKYEDDDYKQVTEGLPKMNAQVEYEGVIYRVTAMNALSGQAKLENRESCIFLSFDDLKNKTISRKGAITKRDPEAEKKPIRKTVTYVNGNAPETRQAPHVSMELDSFAAAEPKPKKNRNAGKKGNAGNPKNESHSAKPRRQAKEKPAANNTEVKKVTVRTFGKKKEAGS